jgi:hypothetical protein
MTQPNWSDRTRTVASIITNALSFADWRIEANIDVGHQALLVTSPSGELVEILVRLPGDRR